MAAAMLEDAMPLADQAKEKRRVKVYELKENDWFDRGTGFCAGRLANPGTEAEETHIFVESEEEADCTLLETKISKDDGYQKQQETLIVWTTSDGVDMALSFQEAEGCAAIWEFVSNAQHRLQVLAADDALSEDAMDAMGGTLTLPPPDLANLEEIERIIRGLTTTPSGRDALGKYIISEDYIRKLVPLVESAEDFESLKDLHLLCNIMKMIILLNDSQIIDHIVSEPIVFGVIGALEYDPDFPNHKANHRAYLGDASRYKEVIKIADESITKKIHATWRLTYIKDVVLARILDDPTFGILNSLIFFNQVDIISHLQENANYLQELFGIIDAPDETAKRKIDAVGFIQSCCSIAKSLHAPARAGLYANFIEHGLLRVVAFAILGQEARLRTLGTEILMGIIDHDTSLVRNHILKSIDSTEPSLTDTLIQLLLTESDLGVKAQAAEAIRFLLEPASLLPSMLQATQGQNSAQGEGQGQSGEAAARSADIMAKVRNHGIAKSQAEKYSAHFFEHSAANLFKSLEDLEGRTTLADLSTSAVLTFSHLIEILINLIRTHSLRCRDFMISRNIIARLAQLLTAHQKHLKLSAVKFFRSCIGIDDQAYDTQLIQQDVFAPLLDIIYETMPRDNLLNSACLELFETIRYTNRKVFILHLSSKHRSRLEGITYVYVFRMILQHWENTKASSSNEKPDMTLYSNDEEGLRTPEHKVNVNGGRWQGIKEMDAAEQDYFDGSDDEDELESAPTTSNRASLPVTASKARANGLAPSPVLRSLVNYPDDDEDQKEEEEDEEPNTSPNEILESAESSQTTPGSSPAITIPGPLDKLSEKRRRQEDDDEEDELGKLSSTTKRRSSGSGVERIRALDDDDDVSHNLVGTGSKVAAGNGPTNNMLRRKKTFTDISPLSNGDGTEQNSHTSKEQNVQDIPKMKFAISISDAAVALAKGDNESSQAQNIEDSDMTQGKDDIS